jgi:hypothetical protein
MADGDGSGAGSVEMKLAAGRKKEHIKRPSQALIIIQPYMQYHADGSYWHFCLLFVPFCFLKGLLFVPRSIQSKFIEYLISRLQNT